VPSPRPSSTPSRPRPSPSADQDPPGQHKLPGAGRRAALAANVRRLITAIREGDDHAVEEAVKRISRSRPLLAPLALLVGGFAMVFHGVRLLVTNWRLTLLQILPAMWIWLAFFDLKLHVLHGRQFNPIRGPILIPIVLAIAGITAAAMFLNAVFAFAITRPGQPEIRPGLHQARDHLRPILSWGVGIGLLLAFSTTIVTRWGHPWFAICLGASIGVLTISYVAVPSRMIGVKPTHSRRDKFAATAVNVTIGAALCTPPYLISRLGILMLGSEILFIPGLVLITFGSTVQAGATGAVNAVKMSAKFLVEDEEEGDGEGATATPAEPAGRPG